MSTKFDPSYIRIIPRDLFNESKLLKCLGRLTLLIHDEMGIQGLTFDHDGHPFRIGLLDDGYLTESTLDFRMNDAPLFLKCQYNSKANFPLYAEKDYCEYLVFDEGGNFTEEFIEFCKTINS